MTTKDSEAATVIGIADLHINSTVALCPRVVQLDDGGTYHASKEQRWLWDAWLDFISLAGKQPGRKIVVIDGDVGELDTKRRSNQLITANKATIQTMILDTLAPLVDLADRVVVIRGTAAHTGKSSWLEEWLAGDLEDDGHSHYHLRAKVGGVRFDIAHHAPMGNLPWTARNAGNRIAALAQWYYAVEFGQPVPDVILRSHNHRWSDSGKNYASLALCLPCWSFATEYTYRTGRENGLADIGGVWITCKDGKYTWDRQLYKPEMRRIWATTI